MQFWIVKTNLIQYAIRTEQYESEQEFQFPDSSFDAFSVSTNKDKLGSHWLLAIRPLTDTPLCSDPLLR